MKRNCFFKIWFGILIILLIISGASIGCDSTQYNTTFAEEEKGFFIEYLTPELFRIVSLKENTLNNGNGIARGNGNSFAEAFKQLEKDYIVEDIIPINYRLGITSELLIKVKPRHK